MRKVGYNEREWRYITPIHLFLELDGVDYRLTMEELLNSDKCEKANDYLKQDPFKLKFTPSDIKYIIVKKEDEIYDLLQRIDSCKPDFSYKDVSILKTRIITASEIKNDT